MFFKIWLCFFVGEVQVVGQSHKSGEYVHILFTLVVEFTKTFFDLLDVLSNFAMLSFVGLSINHSVCPVLFQIVSALLKAHFTVQQCSPLAVYATMSLFKDYFRSGDNFLHERSCELYLFKLVSNHLLQLRCWNILTLVAMFFLSQRAVVIRCTTLFFVKLSGHSASTNSTLKETTKKEP